VTDIKVGDRVRLAHIAPDWSKVGRVIALEKWQQAWVEWNEERHATLHTFSVLSLIPDTVTPTLLREDAETFVKWDWVTSDVRERISAALKEAL